MTPVAAADEVFALLLVFVRVGSALMILPGFGEPYILGRMRLLLALFLSLSMVAPLAPLLPAMPAAPVALVLLVGGEALIGLFIGVTARALFAALHIAGTTIAFQSGLAAAAIFDPNEATQGTLPGNLLSTTALVLLFATDSHHLLLRALAASYGGVPPGADLPLADMADLLARVVDLAFETGIQVAAPLLVVSLLSYLAMGVLNRLMPALQVFFIALPLQLMSVFVTIALALTASLLVFFAMLETGIAELTLGG